MDRRKFLTMLGIAGAAAAIPWKFNTKNFRFEGGRVFPFAQSPTNLTKFVDTLPGVGPGAANSVGQYIPVATATSANFKGKRTDIYRLTVAQFTRQVHPLLPATNFYGYADNSTPGVQRYLGPAIVANRDKPALVYVTNALPNLQLATGNPLLPVDLTLPANELPGGTVQTNADVPFNRIATHLHGGFTPWISDGTPFQWFDPAGLTGRSFMNVPNSNPALGTASYYYTNAQSARLMWYHDHAMGITRTNAYAGIAAPYILLDSFEIDLVTEGILPDLVGIPLVIQDKTFVDPATIGVTDPTWAWGTGGAVLGDLWYPHLYETAQTGGTGFPPACAPDPSGRIDYGPCMVPPAVLPDQATGPIAAFYTLPNASAIPEFFADTPLINGAAYPVLNLTDKRYRFRILNGSQARFYHLNLYAESSTPGEVDTNTPGPPMIQFGTEGGFLPGLALHANGLPIPLDLVNDPSGNTAKPQGPFNLLLAPAERADVIIDFKFLAGQSFILYNDAPAPFPGGDPRNDYYSGDLDFTAPGANPYGLSGGAPPTVAGFGPNTRTLMKIVVAPGPQDAVPTATIMNQLNAKLQTAFLTDEQPRLLYRDKKDPSKPGPVPVDPSIFTKNTVVRNLTLNEDFDEYGRLIQKIGTTTQNGTNNQGLPTWGRAYMDASTENPNKNAVEVWNIYNLTGDAHPIHFHLVNVQVIQRAQYAFVDGVPVFSVLPGTERPPDDNEMGWKETVRMNGTNESGTRGEVITVVMKFTLPTVPFKVPSSPRFAGVFPPKKIAHEYVYHCHILEHEEHDMMRPLVVVA